MVQLKDICLLDNGAHFQTVDLHIHSYGGSHDVRDPNMTPEAIVDSAVRQNLGVIAITDHNSDANVRKAIEYADEKYPGVILVLAGIEITTAHGHLLAYFAPDRQAELSKLISRLDLVGPIGGENTRTAKSMADTVTEVDRLVPGSIPRVRGMAITGGFLHDEKIHFSDNLNCLIGGRGTGKSTAIRALAYAFGLNDDFGDFDNCPDSVAVFCEDENGILYRYVRSRGGDIEVKAKEDRSISDVPIDAFRIEYFGQGELSKVAEDPLKNPELFQEFLDRHTNLRDLVETEESLVTRLRENAGRLNPLESAFQQLDGKKKSLEEIEKKLKLAEEGNLREVVGTQSKLASEKTVRESVEAIAVDFSKDWNLSSFYKDFDQIAATAGTCTEDEALNRTRAEIAKGLCKGAY